MYKFYDFVLRKGFNLRYLFTLKNFMEIVLTRLTILQRYENTISYSGELTPSGGKGGET